MSEAIKLLVIETETGAFVRPETNRDICFLIFDGEKAGKTFHSRWMSVSKVPEVVQKSVNQPNINHRLELKAEFLEENGFSGTTLGKLQPVMPREECQEYGDCSGLTWKKEYAHLASLYEPKSDKVEPVIENVEVEVSVILKIDNIKDYSGMSFPVQSTRWDNENVAHITDKDVNHQALDAIVFPDFMLHARPGRFTSATIYKIVRRHIKENIDLAVCEITSDYDFCFTVKKRILPIQTMQKILDQTRVPQIRSKKTELVTVFEMTHLGENYRGYTPIREMTGKNNAALKQKISRYLKDLMKVLNTPIVYCEHCNGTGVKVMPELASHPKED